MATHSALSPYLATVIGYASISSKYDHTINWVCCWFRPGSWHPREEAFQSYQQNIHHKQLQLQPTSQHIARCFFFRGSDLSGALTSGTAITWMEGTWCTCISTSLPSVSGSVSAASSPQKNGYVDFPCYKWVFKLLLSVSAPARPSQDPKKTKQWCDDKRQA